MKFEPRISPVVDAVRVSRHTVPEIQDMITGTDLRIAYVDGMKSGFKPEPVDDDSKAVVVGTTTSLFVYEGEWLTRDAAGIFRRYEPQEFDQLYEPVV